MGVSFLPDPMKTQPKGWMAMLNGYCWDDVPQIMPVIPPPPTLMETAEAAPHFLGSLKTSPATPKLCAPGPVLPAQSRVELYFCCQAGLWVESFCSPYSLVHPPSRTHHGQWGWGWVVVWCHPPHRCDTSGPGDPKGTPCEGRVCPPKIPQNLGSLEMNRV